MTAKELLQLEIDDAGNQLSRALENVEPALPDFKPHDRSMSMREQVAHLCEAYQATIAAAKGEKHEWGSYTPPSTEWQPLVAEMKALRGKAAKAALEGNDATLKAGFEYIVAHDCYHVGQLASTRIAFDHNWDPYSIYGSE